MKSDTQKAQSAKEFAAFWSDKGSEKQDTQKFWIELLANVLDLVSPTQVIDFEKKVEIDGVKYIDAYIEETRTIIEQKGCKINLDSKEKQSDGAELTPFEQAKRYNDNLPFSEKARWIVICNFREWRIYDLEKPQDSSEVLLLSNLEKEFYRLDFLIDKKNENIRREEDISIKAGLLVKKLYNSLLPQYKAKDEKELRSLNILCVRLVFCFYAEKSGLFLTHTAFEDYLKKFSQDALVLSLLNLFKALDTKIEERNIYDTSIKDFPYVDGGLFKDEDIVIPAFTKEICDILLNDFASFNWSEISPTIFGALFENTLNPLTRDSGGMHYTSIANIHKLIDPIFFAELEQEFNSILSITAIEERNKRLFAFQKKIGALKFLDPACGSGNFLTETFLSLRRLENECIKLRLGKQKTALDVLGDDFDVQVKIENFYGIEINDFAVTVAKTAMWIAECQMMRETSRILGKELSFLPLQTSANIVENNALRLDWKTLKPIDENAIIDGLFAGFDTELDGSVIDYNYIIGNPPFIGARTMDKESTEKVQKEDVLRTFGKDWKNVGNLDYVCCWHKKAFELLQGTKIKAALVSTNSITQGNAVANLWKPLFESGLCIDFAYRTFKWENETNDKEHMAQVHCVIIGFSDKEMYPSHTPKHIYNDNGSIEEAENINAYLLNAPNIFVDSRVNSLCTSPELLTGSQRLDDDN